MFCQQCHGPAGRQDVCHWCRRENAIALVALWLVALLVAVILWLAVDALAKAEPPPRPVPAAAWTTEAAHVLARGLVAEADFSQADHAAIAWVLAKRWPQYRANVRPVSFARYVRRYVSLWKLPDTPRKREIRGLPWGPSKAPHGRARWDATRRWVEAWAAGQVPDPCPSARHWGGPRVDSFPVGARWARCGETVNRFYSVGPMRGEG